MELIIFDLDGTLIDSGPDIAASVNLLRESESLTRLRLDVIESFIGNGVRRLLERAMHDVLEPLSATRANERLDELQSAYRAIYQQHLLDETRMFPGVEHALATLKDHVPMAVLTNKPYLETEMILDGLAMNEYFEEVCGGDTFERKKPHPVGIQTLLAKFGIDSNDAVMVGDSIVDQQTAINGRVPFCLVTYGLGSSSVPSEECAYVVDDLGPWSQEMVFGR